MPQREVMMAVARRALSHYVEDTTDQAQGVLRVPVSEYLDEDRHRAELDVIFRRVPLALAMSIEVAAPGDYKAMDAAGVPVLMVRGDDGVVRAFVNSCRHRGAQVCETGRGNRPRFKCPYHSWTYDAGGRLSSVYKANTFGDVDTASLGLVSLPTAEACGFVWVSLTPGELVDLDGWLGPIRAELESLHLEQWHLCDQRVLPGPGWKVAYDGYLESYHISSLHRRTFAAHTVTNLMVVDAFAQHQRIVYPSRSLASLRRLPEEEWDPAQHCGAVYALFPNLSIAGTWQDYGVVSLIMPGPTVDRSMTVQTIIARNQPDSDAEYAAAFSDLMARGVGEEDYGVAFSVQSSLPSRPDVDILLGRNELAVQHFHRWVNHHLENAGATAQSRTASMW